MTNADLVERLVASHRGEDLAIAEHGRKCGRRWAEDTASPRQLVRLAAWVESDGGPAAWAAKPLPDPAELVAAIITGCLDLHPDGVRDFWLREVRMNAGTNMTDAHSPAFARAFVEAALQVWAKVAGKVTARCGPLAEDPSV